jgi:hypothetical protein
MGRPNIRKGIKSFAGGVGRALGFDIPTAEENEQYRLDEARHAAALANARREASISEQQMYSSGVGSSTMQDRAKAAHAANINIMGKGLKLINKAHRRRVKPGLIALRGGAGMLGTLGGFALGGPTGAILGRALGEGVERSV